MISTDTSANVIQGVLPPQDRAARRSVWGEPRAVALLWLAGYLVVTGVILVTGQRWGLVGLHVALLALLVPTIKCHPERSEGSPVRVEMRLLGYLGDFLPLIAAPLLYGELPTLIAAAGTSYHDAMIQRWELALFGFQPSHTLAARLPNLALSELLHAGYLAYYAVIFLPPLLLLAKGRRRPFAETVLALTVTCTVCWAIFVAMPVEGPRYLWSAPLNVPNGPVRRLVLSILAAGSSRGAAFPSSHMAVSVAMAVTALRWQRPVGWGVALVALLIGFGAVYGGFHYGVDMIAGAALGAATSLGVIAVFKTGASAR
jgi:membrane-associated phospholipid phosphatase